MEITELTLWVARLGVLALMYLFLLALVLALRADVAAAKAPAKVAPPAAMPSAAPQVSPAQHVGQMRLVLVGGTVPTTGGEYPLSGPLDFGRDATCTVCIPNHFVSKRHAHLFVHNGQWLVEDLGSTNGTLLNGQPLTQAQPFAKGDHITVGDTEFIVQ